MFAQEFISKMCASSKMRANAYWHAFCFSSYPQVSSPHIHRIFILIINDLAAGGLKPGLAKCLILKAFFLWICG